MNKVLVCTPIVTGVGPKAYYHHINMWKHVGEQRQNANAPSVKFAPHIGTDVVPYDTTYGAAPFVEGPRKSPRLIRNRAVQEFLRSGATHLFFLDDDILCPPNIIDLLLSADKPIIGALIHNNEGTPLVWEQCDGGERPMYYPNVRGIFPCYAVALGGMLIKREVLERLSEPWFYFEKNHRTMDINFCKDAGAAGFEVWCSVEAACKQIVHDEREI